MPADRTEVRTAHAAQASARTVPSLSSGSRRPVARSASPIGLCVVTLTTAAAAVVTISGHPITEHGATPPLHPPPPLPPRAVRPGPGHADGYRRRRPTQVASRAVSANRTAATPAYTARPQTAASAGRRRENTPRGVLTRASRQLPAGLAGRDQAAGPAAGPSTGRRALHAGATAGPQHDRRLQRPPVRRGTRPGEPAHGPGGAPPEPIWPGGTGQRNIVIIIPNGCGNLRPSIAAAPGRVHAAGRPGRGRNSFGSMVVEQAERGGRAELDGQHRPGQARVGGQVGRALGARKASMRCAVPAGAGSPRRCAAAGRD